MTHEASVVEVDRDTWMLLYKAAYLLAWRTSYDHEYAHRLAMANVATLNHGE